MVLIKKFKVFFIIFIFIFLNCDTLKFLSKEEYLNLWGNPDAYLKVKPEAEYLLNGNANNAIHANFSSWNGYINNISWTDNRFNQSNCAASFNGIDSYIDLLLLIDYLGTSETCYSISIWVKIPFTSLGDQTIVSSYDSSTIDDTYLLDLYLDNSNRIICYTNYSGNQYSLTSINSYNDNKWHLITFVVNIFLDRQFLYIDKSLIATQSILSNIVIPYYDNGRLRIGVKKINNKYDKYFEGCIDDLRLFGSELTDIDVNYIFESK